MEFVLRPLRMSDKYNFAECANNIKLANNLRNAFPHPYDVGHAEYFINHVQETNPNGVLAISIDGKACGAIGLHPQSDVYSKNSELGYWLAEKYWGKGIMTGAIKQMVEYGFSCFDISRIYAGVFHGNIASQRVLEKAGFELEGTFKKAIFKNGSFLDERMYAIRNN